MTESIEQIFYEYGRRRNERADIFERCRRIAQAYNNDIALPLPEVSAEEAPAVANLLGSGIDQHAMRIASVMPDVQCPPVSIGQNASEKRGDKRRRACVGYWEVNSYDLIQRRRARSLIAYGQTAVFQRPDSKIKQPKWEVRSPLETYPADMDATDMQPDDCIFGFTRTLSWMRQNYPELAHVQFQIPSKWGPMSFLQPSDPIDVVQWVSGEEIVWLCVGEGTPTDVVQEAEYGIQDGRIINLGPSGDGQKMWAAELSRMPNRLEMCPVTVPGRITLADLKGQFDDSIGLYQMQAKLMAMDVNAIANGIWPDQWLVSSPQQQAQVITHADGRRGKIGVISGGELVTTQVQPGQQTTDAIDRLERGIRLSGSIPANFGGECVDEGTQILTAHGWKDHTDVAVGDEVLTLNHDTGLSEWRPVQKMNVFPAEKREMRLMEGQRFSALTTMNHRWAVLSRHGVRKWTTSAEMTDRHHIPIAALNANLPVEAKWSDALVELVAWFYTEGHRRPNRAQISQSITRNPENVERIAASLRALFGAPTNGWRNLSGCGQGGVGHDRVPRWNQTAPNDHGVVKFDMSAHAALIFDEHAPNKVPTFEFLRSLTQAQLELFLHVSMLADNCGEARFGQKDQGRTEAFAFAALLAGNATSYQTRVHLDDRPAWPASSTAHIARIRKRRTANPVQNAKMVGTTDKIVTYDGVVWCPTTPNATWLARRNGSVYFTGNSASNIRTAVQSNAVLGDAVDFTIQEHQNILARSAQHELEIAAQIDLTYFGNQKKSFYVSWKGGKGRLDYTPQDIWSEDRTIRVNYAKAGADVNALDVAIGQMVGVGILSKKTGSEMHPDIKDPEFEHDQVTFEALEAAILSGIQQQAAAGSLPLTDLAAIMTYVRTDNMTLVDAINKAQQDAQARQSSTVSPAEPGSPEAQPGLAQPGQGAEAGTAIPPESPSLQNLTMLLRSARTGGQIAQQGAPGPSAMQAAVGAP